MVEDLGRDDPQQVGRYRLLRRLATGDVGDVYLGRAGTGIVSVQIIKPEVAATPGFVPQFNSEIAAAKQVRGRYTVRIVDFGVQDKSPWLATQYANVPTLAETVERQGPLIVESIRRLSACLAAGLDEIHDAGIAHRRLTPQKVFLVRPEWPRITGFGIPWTPPGSFLTANSMFVGIPGFMSPEMIQGGDAGLASEVFSLGAVLAYAATGKEPFGSGPPDIIAQRVVHASPDLSEVPPVLRSLLQDSMAKDPRDRPDLSDFYLSGQRGSSYRSNRFRWRSPPVRAEGRQIPYLEYTEPDVSDEELPTVSRRDAGLLPEADRAMRVSPSRRTAWPHLAAPASVIAGHSFPVEVGLGEKQDLALYGTGELGIPLRKFTLGIELIVDGFVVDGDRTFSLEVTADDPYPKRTITLIGRSDPEYAEQRRIGVVFRVGKNMRGYAGRDIYVNTSENQPVPQPAVTAPSYGGFNVSPFKTRESADLTIIIQQGDARYGTRLVWSVASPHFNITLPPDPAGLPLQASGEKFLAELVAGANTTKDPLNLTTSLTGKGKAQIAPLIPPFVKDALRNVAQHVAPRRPTVLLLSQDPYIPWEMAVLDPPLPGWPPDASPFLGAQAVIGRWVLASEPPPLPDPPKHIKIRDQVVVAADYTGVPGWPELKSAAHEEEALLQRWPGAHRVDASLPAVLACLSGTPEADIIHFALHGEFSVDDEQQGLVLIETVNGRKYPVHLKPSHVDAGMLRRAALVFVNACQVGAGRAVLGSYSGMASAFVRTGAAAVIAPLWSVDDETASAIAVDFYRQALDGSKAPAEVLRTYRAGVTRAAIAANDPAASGTYIAYQFFGHPNLHISEAPRYQKGN